MSDEARFFEIIVDKADGGDASEWYLPHQEGQLAVDVLETAQNIVVISTIAGIRAEKVEVNIHNDLLTIRGEREHPLVAKDIREHYYEECYWGRFSRSIVLPVDVKGDLAKAEYTNGILVIRIPKRDAHRQIPVIVVEE